VGHLGDQPDHLFLLAGRVGDGLCLWVEGGEGGEGAHQDPHRVSVVVEAVDELLDVLVHVRVVGDLLRPRGGLLLARQLAPQQHEGYVQERDSARQLLDRVAAVAQDPLLPVDEGDGAAAAGGVEERRVIRQQPEFVV
jgi:hypothetical protein